MNDSDQGASRRDAAQDRASRLSAAVLRISQSLDVATVLKEVVESARTLTGARHRVIMTIDERGTVRDFVTSGLGQGKLGNKVEWEDGIRFFEHLQSLSVPLRVADLPDYLCSLGLSQFSIGMTLQGTPLQHRGEHLGDFFLGNKEGGEAFTAEDEEILVLFASQAATTISNARTHREVERARADLEALVETSPVGVVVFGAATLSPVSLNREARRIVGSPRSRRFPCPRSLRA